MICVRIAIFAGRLHRGYSSGMMRLGLPMRCANQSPPRKWRFAWKGLKGALRLPLAIRGTSMIGILCRLHDGGKMGWGWVSRSILINRKNLGGGFGDAAHPVKSKQSCKSCPPMKGQDLQDGIDLQEAQSSQRLQSAEAWLSGGGCFDCYPPFTHGAVPTKVADYFRKSLKTSHLTVRPGDLEARPGDFCSRAGGLEVRCGDFYTRRGRFSVRPGGLQRRLGRLGGRRMGLTVRPGGFAG